MKKRESNKKRVRVNKRILAKEIRLITSDGRQAGIIPTYEALKTAEDEGLDLVEISPTADPPVCKIMDYGKYMFQQKKKQHDAKKKQKTFQVKEIKLKIKTEKHDLDFKEKHIERFLKAGHKVKITMRLYGREMALTKLADERMKNMAEMVSELGSVEQPPKLEGRQMVMVLMPKI